MPCNVFHSFSCVHFRRCQSQVTAAAFPSGGTPKAAPLTLQAWQLSRPLGVLRLPSVCSAGLREAVHLVSHASNCSDAPPPWKKHSDIRLGMPSQMVQSKVSAISN